MLRPRNICQLKALAKGRADKFFLRRVKCPPAWLTSVNLSPGGNAGSPPRWHRFSLSQKAMRAELEVEQEKDGGWIVTIPAGQDPKTF
jgi:hypothetical protein